MSSLVQKQAQVNYKNKNFGSPLGAYNGIYRIALKDHQCDYHYLNGRCQNIIKKGETYYDTLEVEITHTSPHKTDHLCPQCIEAIKQMERENFAYRCQVNTIRKSR